MDAHSMEVEVCAPSIKYFCSNESLQIHILLYFVGSGFVSVGALFEPSSEILVSFLIRKWWSNIKTFLAFSLNVLLWKHRRKQIK